MEPEDREICSYLKSMPGQFVSARNIARRAGGKWRFHDNPEWAEPVLARLLEKKIIETDFTHHYRLIPKREKKDRKWISPQMKQLLEKSGKDFPQLTEEEELPPDVNKE